MLDQDGRLTDEKTVLACVDHGPSSRFSLRETLTEWVNPGVRDLVNYIPDDLPDIDTTAAAVCHIIALSLSVLNVFMTALVLPFGRLHINGYCLLMAVVMSPRNARLVVLPISRCCRSH